MTGENFLWVAKQCLHSYKPQVDNYNKFIRVIDNKESDVYVVINSFAEGVLITFRGSDSKKDWKTNLTLIKKTIPYGNISSPIKVHSGFLTAYKSVREDILQQIGKDIKRVIVTGHSQGGALATLCAVDIEYNFSNIQVELYGYGSPRVGNRAFAKSYNKRVPLSFRIVTRGDMVTKVPPVIMGYRHVGIGYKLPSPVNSDNHSIRSYIQSLIATTQFRQIEILTIAKDS